jgi:hypothetical protein
VAFRGVLLSPVFAQPMQLTMCADYLALLHLFAGAEGRFLDRLASILAQQVDFHNVTRTSP